MRGKGPLVTLNPRTSRPRLAIFNFRYRHFATATFQFHNIADS
jgi:hypothetical protein